MNQELKRENVLDALERVLIYLWQDEELHYRETMDESNDGPHIFESCKLLRNWLDLQNKYKSHQHWCKLFFWCCLLSAFFTFLPELIVFFEAMQ